MRSAFLIFPLIVFSYSLQAQSICGTVDEGQTLTMTAPVGQVFVAIVFASYGTPNGSCGSFTQGACHASNSVTIVQGYLIGNNSANIPATNGTFGDPCSGTFKRLYVQAIYGSPAPLKLISFAGSAKENNNMLKWETTDEVNTKQFEVEKSIDGVNFIKVGTVPSNNRTGNNFYSFTDNVQIAGICFYRLKMLDLDGKFTYSNIIRLSNKEEGRLSVFPNPATDLVSLNGLKAGGYIEIINSEGKVLKIIRATASTETINVSDFPRGIYIIKNIYNGQASLEKMIKQ